MENTDNLLRDMGRNFSSADFFSLTYQVETLITRIWRHYGTNEAPGAP